LAGLLAAVLALGACARPPEAQPIAWQQLPSGLHYARTTTHVGPDRVAVPIHLIALFPAQFELRVVRAQDYGQVLAEAEFFSQQCRRRGGCQRRLF
jgi:hypothetical protein